MGSNSNKIRQKTLLEMGTTQNMISIPYENEDSDLILSFRKKGLMGNYTNSKINLSKFKNEFSFKRSFDMVAFLGFCLYLWEIGSDAWLSYNFIHGANYTKIVHSINDTAHSVEFRAFVCA